MELGALIDILTTLSLAAGLVFAGVEWRRTRAAGRRESQVQVLRSFDTPEFMRAMRVVLDLPDDLRRADIEARVGAEGSDLVWHWLGIMESLGLLVHDRYVDIHDVDQTFGGPTILGFDKLRRYIDDIRAETRRATMYEWYQWLADRLRELERAEGRSPAHVRERDWRP